MDVAYHIGAHCTDDDRLLKCLLKNRGSLARQGIIVPGPSRYRPVLREMLVSLRGRPASPQMQQIILDAAMDEEEARRLIFANQSFLCVPAKVVGEHMLYPMAGEKTAWLANLFPQSSCAFFLGMRNPASFVPALFARSGEARFEDFVAGAEPRRLKWSDTVRRIRDANPQAQLTVWSNEDTPLIWPELLAAIAGVPPGTRLRGGDDLLSEIISPEGMREMRARLDSDPPADPAAQRQLVERCLEAHAIPDAVEEELDAPGWSIALVEELTDLYERDLSEIAAMDGVTFLAA